MSNSSSKSRQVKIPPHVDLRTLRIVSGQTLESVCSRATDYLRREDPDAKLTVGAVSALELGYRGASDRTLAALEHAFGIDAGSLSTDYLPRRPRLVVHA